MGLTSRASQSRSKIQKHLTLSPPPRRTLHPNQKIFLIESRRLAAPVEALNTSLAIAAGEL